MKSVFFLKESLKSEVEKNKYMFFGLNPVHKHPVYKIQTAIRSFFHYCVKNSEFKLNCFPEWFRPIVSNSPKLKSYFERIAELMGEQSEEVRQQVFNVFQNNNQIKLLCEDNFSELLKIDEKLADLKLEVIKLFYHLYDKTLATDILYTSLGNKSIDDHYKEFLEVNNSVCPFCCLEYYIGIRTGTRSPYDHYLTRAFYPFAGINFENLIPMCERCNSPANKGVCNIIFSPDLSQRRQVFYPYNEFKGIKLRVDCLKEPTFSNKGEWKVEIKPLDKRDLESIETWKNVFNIISRLEDRLIEQNQAWMVSFIGDQFDNIKLNITNFRRTLKKEAEKLSDDYYWRTIIDSALQGAFFKYLANNGKTKIIQSYCDIAKTRYIAKTATRGRTRINN